jgi:hypothetical protein
MREINSGIGTSDGAFEVAAMGTWSMQPKVSSSNHVRVKAIRDMGRDFGFAREGQPEPRKHVVNPCVDLKPQAEGHRADQDN